MVDALDGADRTVAAWRAWYTDKRVFESTKTNWTDLPAEGVLCIRLYYGSGGGRGRFMSGSDLYWNDGDIYAHDDVAAAIIRDGLEEAGQVKRGRWTTDDEMAWANQSMMKAEDAPQ
jgi:hypothetical protein